MACRRVTARLASITPSVWSALYGSALAFFIVIGSAYPLQTNAGFGSFAASFFTNTTEAANNVDDFHPDRTVSSQNVALLLATAQGDGSSPASDTADINIVNDSALMADSGPLGTIANVEDYNVNADTISIYTVRDGDTIQKIAKMFDVSVNTILWANNLRGPKDISVGQELVILPVNGIKYTIRRGDTIQSIARRYGGDVNEILQFNNLDRGQKLAIGEEIIIPNGEATSQAVSSGHYVHVISKIIKTYIDGAIDSLAYYIQPIVHGHRTQGLHGKNAVDLAPDCHCVGKEAIIAAADGEVIVARTSGWNGGYGNYVAIAHPNGTQTLYGHMYSVAVHPGQEVQQGQFLGYVGSTGNSTGPHVHFEIRGARNPF